MFQIKICGITSAADAQMAFDAGADCVGLNFYAGSPRYLRAETAEEIAAAAPDGLTRVGVFVNAQANSICQVAERLALDFVQLHGDEPPEFIAELAEYSVIKAFRLGPVGLAPVTEYLERCYQLAALPAMVLLDAYRQGTYGGTGRTVDWRAAREYHELGAGPALILAGGLTAENVADAIDAVRPAAVDTASGVESAPGQKDADKVAAFIASARAGFARADRDGQ